MSRNKPDSLGTIEAEQLPGSGRTFRDTLYTSRTLVLPDDSTMTVTKARVTAITDEQLAFLKAHPDLELVQE
jgi:hypothetical protein